MAYDGPERRHLPADWLFNELSMLKDETKERHERLRGDMKSGFDLLVVKLDQHAKDDAAVEKRVTIIETQRTDEEKQAVRRGTWAGILAAAGLTGALKAIEHLWK